MSRNGIRRSVTRSAICCAVFDVSVSVMTSLIAKTDWHWPGELTTWHDSAYPLVSLQSPVVDFLTNNLLRNWKSDMRAAAVIVQAVHDRRKSETTQIWTWRIVHQRHYSDSFVNRWSAKLHCEVIVVLYVNCTNKAAAVGFFSFYVLGLFKTYRANHLKSKKYVVTFWLSVNKF